MSAPQIDPRLLLLAEGDNVCVACRPLVAGESLVIDRKEVVLSEAAPTGFKIARQGISKGDKVLKYGAAIGSATADIGQGAIVHTHNLKSDYLPTYLFDNAEDARS